MPSLPSNSLASLHLDDDSPALDDERIPKIARHFEEILRILGLDLEDPNLADTPTRVGRMYLEVFAGLDSGNHPRLTTFPNREGYDQMVTVRDVPFYSMCAHHFLPFFGRAHVAYFPSERFVGLSKLARIVEFYARRPQLQERLTEQIINCLQTELRPSGAMVVLQANHLCMEMRGVQKPGAQTTTSAIRGIFNNRAVREEFLELLQRA